MNNYDHVAMTNLKENEMNDSICSLGAGRPQQDSR